MRTFKTGATRDGDDGKYDYEAFFSPAVLERRAEYMHSHRLQKDGTMRDGDNWQKGMGQDVFFKSLWRHFMDAWLIHRGVKKGDLQEAVCAMMFNCEGILHEDIWKNLKKK